MGGQLIVIADSSPFGQPTDTGSIAPSHSLGPAGSRLERQPGRLLMSKSDLSSSTTFVNTLSERVRRAEISASIFRHGAGQEHLPVLWPDEFLDLEIVSFRALEEE
jgi:hypothetical protein